MSISPEQIGILACSALQKEALLTPKPGLVDAQNSGAHDDMDVRLLILSAKTLEPYFVLFAETGTRLADQAPDGKLGSIRADGKAAQEAMFLATNGINTHKGALFLLGALCYAAGYCARNDMQLSAETICAVAGRVCEGVTAELGTNAGRAFAQYGAPGARGEAEAGFPNAILARNAYLSARMTGAEEDVAWLLSLLALISNIVDTNVLSRCGEEISLGVKSRADALRRRYPAGGKSFIAELSAFDQDCISLRASPGGAADLLACAMFLHDLAAIEPRDNQL